MGQGARQLVPLCAQWTLGKHWLAAIVKKLWNIAWNAWEHRNHVLRKEQEALLHQQEDAAIHTERAAGFEHFPKHLRTHTCCRNIGIAIEARRAPSLADNH
jgi:hypothetical protein